MQILNFSWKNFNSYGNSIQRIDLSQNKGDLYLLIGGNGHGKSTIAEVVTFALYGKIERKNKSDLPNRINKNLWCKIEIKSRGKFIEIERGVSPGLFEVKIDGAPYDTAGNSNVQDYLELEIFDIPYQVFKNIIVLSINDFKSFLTMSPGDKRNIIDRLFGFSIINQMKDSIKNERKEIKDKIKTILDELGIIEESITSINSKLEHIEKTKNEDQKNSIQEYKEKIIELIDQKKAINLELEKIKKLESTIIEKFSDKEKNHYKIEYDIKSLENKIRLYENSICPTCGSDLHTDEHNNKKDLCIEEKNEKYKEYKNVDEEIKSLNHKINIVKSKITESEKKIEKINLYITKYKVELQKTAEDSEINSEYLNELIVENISKKNEREFLKEKVLIEDQFLDIVENVLGDDGVKNLAMKTILPSLNQNITNMAKQMNLLYSIKFNDKFDCVINSLGEEINPRSMSTGERKKADFIIIIALLKLLKVRYPSLNLLFLDEIFSSVDSSGVYEIIKILNEVSKENKLNTWVINHTELPTELFDKKVEVLKESGFSKIKIEDVS